MKYIILLSVIGFVAAAEFGGYVPKAYYTIDEEGQRSAPVYIDAPHVLNRVRRQQPGFPFGGQQQGFPFAPFPNFPQIQPGAPGTTFTGISTSQNLGSRFSDDDQSSQTHVYHGQGSNIQGTHTYVDKDGKTQTSHTSTGKV